MDADGALDLVVSSFTTGGSVTVYRGDGTGAFELAATLPIHGQGIESVVEDINDDGILDIATSRAGLILVHHGTGDFNFRVPESVVAAVPHTLVSADFDHDGRIDLATCGFFGEVTVVLNDDGATFKTESMNGQMLSPPVRSRWLVVRSAGRRPAVTPAASRRVESGECPVRTSGRAPSATPPGLFTIAQLTMH